MDKRPKRNKGIQQPTNSKSASLPSIKISLFADQKVSVLFTWIEK
jgi:hypothetical protein